MPVTLITYKVKDSEDNVSSMPVYYDAADVNTVADAQGIATSFAPLFNAVSGCKIIGAEVAFPLTVPVPAAVTDGYRNDAGATMSFYNSEGRAWSMFVPGFLGTLMSNKVVNTAGAGVTNFTNKINT